MDSLGYCKCNVIGLGYTFSYYKKISIESKHGSFSKRLLFFGHFFKSIQSPFHHF